MTRKVDAKQTLFGIPPINVSEYSLRLKEFMLEVVAPLIYERFIGAWKEYLKFYPNIGNKGDISHYVIFVQQGEKQKYFFSIK